MGVFAREGVCGGGGTRECALGVCVGARRHFHGLWGRAGAFAGG